MTFAFIIRNDFHDIRKEETNVTLQSHAFSRCLKRFFYVIYFECSMDVIIYLIRCFSNFYG